MSDLTTFRPNLAPRSVYVHIPFCRHRCGYCNFALVADRDHLIDRFLAALEKEISWLECSFEIDTLFFGGGTPSHLPPSALQRLRVILESRFSITNQAEITAECNPNDLDPAKCDALAQLGVNRISLGVQSLMPAKLTLLERSHSPADVAQAVELARSFVQSVSLDLIFAAPHETIAEWEQDLELALTLQPDHLSTYELTYERGTRFWQKRTRGTFREQAEDHRATMYQTAIKRLEQAGLHQYEISSFAALGHQCQHNLAYWKGVPYFAFGPGASRFIDGIRDTNHQSLMFYLKQIESDQSPAVDREHLTGLSAAQERMAIGLRMRVGVEESQFESQTGYSCEQVIGQQLTDFIENDLLVRENGRIRLTSDGVMLADWIAGKIVG